MIRGEEEKLGFIWFTVYKLFMIRLNMHEAKTHLSCYVGRLLKGETIILCKRNVPIAEIRPLPRSRRSKRPVGLARGQFKVPPRFFEPLPEEGLDSFRPTRRS